MRRKRWVICLTDGEDNSSRIPAPNLREKIVRTGVSLVVVGISLDADSRATIVDLCAASDKGAYIDVTDSSDQLQAAFATVAAMITQDVALEDF